MDELYDLNYFFDDLILKKLDSHRLDSGEGFSILMSNSDNYIQNSLNEMLISLNPICTRFIEKARTTIFILYEKIIEKNFKEFPKMQNEVTDIIEDMFDEQKV